MDLLAEIKSKLPSLDGHPSGDGVRAAIWHIEVAERWFDRSREEREEDLLNDVVYRTNQAFEGMLKEAFTLLTGEKVKSLKTHQIEERLLKEEALTPRVRQLVQNYRQSWRNESTHDHRLLFKEQESLLAIVSVSAFATILLDEIIEAVNYQREQAELESRRKEIQKELGSDKAATLHEQLAGIVARFGRDLAPATGEGNTVRESEVLGRLAGFIESVQPDIKVRQHAKIREALPLAPDLVAEREDERVILELKLLSADHPSRATVQRGAAQLAAYMVASGTDAGVLFLPSQGAKEQLHVHSIHLQGGSQPSVMHVVAPESYVRLLPGRDDDPYGF